MNTMEDKVLTGLGIGFTLLFESQIFPFMLSSAFTARTIVKEKDQVKDVQIDVGIATALSIGFSLMMSYFLHNTLIALIGTILGIGIAVIYELRGELLEE